MDVNADTMSKLTPLAWQYGPFFFSLLFLVGITAWTNKLYRDACNRPQAEPSEISTCRMIFIASFVCGVILTGLSVGWWWWKMPGEYVFTGEIKNLKDYETITSDDIYFRSQPRPYMTGDPYKLRNEHFAVVQNSPFRKGQIFEFDFSKGESKRNTFKIKYAPNTHPTYIIDWDEQAKDNVIKEATSATLSRFGFHLLPSAYAQKPAAGVQAERPVEFQQKAAPIAALKKPGIDLQLVSNVQNPRSDVGTKIAAVDALTSMSSADIQRYMQGTGSGEPLALTILDLTHHSDRELAYKATVLANKADVNGIIARDLSSQDPKAKAAGTEMLKRVDQPRAADILKRANMKSSVKAPPTSVLVPTASSQGDRYYVRATWDPRNKTAVTCLTKVFNTELISNRTLDEESKLMDGRSDRLVYWYDKNWALSIASKIQGCGGQAAFVQPPMSK